MYVKVRRTIPQPKNMSKPCNLGRIPLESDHNLLKDLHVSHEVDFNITLNLFQ